MTRSILLTLEVAASLSLLAAAGSTQRRGRNVETNVRDHEPVTSCDQIDVRFEDAQTFRAEEHQTIPRAAVEALRVESSRNGGGIYLRGVDANEYSITLCKAAASWADGGTLNDIALTTANGRVEVKGPSTDGWVGYLLVTMPRNAAADVRTSNGPLSVADVAGSLGVHSTNGPISLSNCSGTVVADAQNGPISVSGGGGSIHIKTENGPITVALSGTTWNGDGLEVHAQNGPLTLRVPERYESGVELEISMNSPFSCRGAVCTQSQRDWDSRSRTLRFGGSRTAVRLSTVNGPVTVDSRD